MADETFPFPPETLTLSTCSELTATVKMIEAREVTEGQFRAMLRRYFEPLGWGSWDFPHQILEHLRAFSADYQEAPWRYYMLSNDGFYVAPDTPQLQVCMNQTAEMSADAAGIATCLFVLEGLGVLDPRVSHHCEQLHAFADQHPEAELIRFVAAAPATSDEVSDGFTP
jgi:hypothetical protein